MHQHKEVLNPYTGERVCARCGLVLGQTFSDMPSRNPGRKYGEPFHQRERDLAELERRHDRNLGTELYPFKKRSPGVKLDTLQWWNRVRKYNLNASSRERRLREIFCEIDRICGLMRLPRRAQNELCYAFRKLAGHLKGIPYKQVLAILIYRVCRLHQIPRRKREVDRMFQEFYGDSYSKSRGRWIRDISGLVRQLGYSDPENEIDQYIFGERE